MDLQLGPGTDAAGKYTAIAVGLAIGTAAKYGLTLSEGKELTWRGVLGDTLLLAFIGLIALIVANWLNLTGDYRVLAGALSAVASDRLARLVRDKFEQRAAAEIDRIAGPSGVSNP